MGHGDQHINLPGGLNFAPDEARVDEVMALMLPGTYHLGRPWTDRAAWEKVRRSKAGERLLEEARQYETDEPRCYFTNEDCVYVMETNDRTKFDPLPPRARSSLALLPIVECLEPTGRLIPRIEELVGRLCAVNSWTFPLHERARDFHERRDIFTDLASVHYAGNLVTALHLLGDRLSPEIRDMIRTEVDVRIFQPFEERIKSGREIFWWATVTHNWNSVLLSCMLGCALELKEDARERAWYVAVVEKLIRHSEEGFEPSGFYTEGVAYWGYGFSHYVLAAELVFGATGGRIDWMKKPRVEKVSHFSARMEIQDGAYPTFADCQKDVKSPQWLMHWLNNRIDPRRTARSTETPTEPFDPIHFQFAEILHLILFHQVDINKAYAGPEPRAIREWFEDVQFLISRPGPTASTRMAATFKGGHNGANHNHNDLGTFTVLVGAVELLTDPGAEIYTVRTFSTNRYLGKLLNSFGHPVPVVAGKLQFPDETYHRTGFGRDAYAEVIDSHFTDERDQVILALDRAYKVPDLINLIRAFTYNRTGKGSVEVLDKVKFSSPETFETALITYADWERMPDGRLRVSSQGAAVEVEVSSADGELVFDHCVIQESSTPTRLSWRFREPVSEATVRFFVRPLDGG
ncbi:MAG: heparinase II/III family protein [Opitutaceae bacterium]